MNTHNNHTPGPWEKNAYRVFSDAKRIAEIDTAYMTHDETHSNARLIAAAPELLRSLHYIAERLQHGGRAAKSDCLTQCQWAITKATGGADQ
jgi:hypothetical protein